jgi:hypothetical protein
MSLGPSRRLFHPSAEPADSTDGGAPLIGSSLASRTVRARLEKVADTTFTVPIEGGSGPQPHPDFIDVFCQAAVGGGDGAVAGAKVARGSDTSLRAEVRRAGRALG